MSEIIQLMTGQHYEVQAIKPTDADTSDTIVIKHNGEVLFRTYIPTAEDRPWFAFHLVQRNGFGDIEVTLEGNDL